MRCGHGAVEQLHNLREIIYQQDSDTWLQYKLHFVLHTVHTGGLEHDGNCLFYILVLLFFHNVELEIDMHLDN